MLNEKSLKTNWIFTGDAGRGRVLEPKLTVSATGSDKLGADTLSKLILKNRPKNRLHEYLSNYDSNNLACLLFCARVALVVSQFETGNPHLVTVLT